MTRKPGDHMTKIIASDTKFSDIERRVITAISEGNITNDEATGLPAASDPPILSMILEKAEHFSARLKPDIQLLLAETDPFGVSPTELTNQLDKDPRFRSFGRILTIIIMQAYYQDPRVLQSLGLEARPPFPLGHEMEPDDWSLLEPVIKRAPFYRPA